MVCIFQKASKYLCWTNAVIQKQNASWAEWHYVIPARRRALESNCVIHVLILKQSTVTPFQPRNVQSVEQMWCVVLPDALASTSEFMKFWVSFCSMLCSFISLSHFIWLGPISPHLARLLLLLNKSSWELSRLEKDFHRKVPTASSPSFIQAESLGPQGERTEKIKRCLPLPSLLIWSLAQMPWGSAHTERTQLPTHSGSGSIGQPSQLCSVWVPSSSQETHYPPEFQ